MLNVLLIGVAACAISMPVLAAGGKNRNASDQIEEGLEQCVQSDWSQNPKAANGVTITYTVPASESETGVAYEVTVDCGDGPSAGS